LKTCHQTIGVSISSFFAPDSDVGLQWDLRPHRENSKIFLTSDDVSNDSLDSVSPRAHLNGLVSTRSIPFNVSFVIPSLPLACNALRSFIPPILAAVLHPRTDDKNHSQNTQHTPKDPQTQIRAKDQ
jgi:hypothetical protein